MMLECKINSIKYRNKVVIENLEFSLERGKLLLLTGLSGSGKSTLLTYLAGILENNKSAVIDGYYTFDNCDKDEIAYISQNPEANLICNDVMSELLLAGTNDIEQIKNILTTFNVNPNLLGQKTQHLSGGEQQILSVICSILRGCKVYLFDEPTTMLDDENKGLVVQAIQKLRKFSKTILIASHDEKIWSFYDERINLSQHQNLPVICNFSLDNTINNSLIIFDVSNIRFGYSSFDILISNLSFKLTNGDCLLIKGKNGSGKTTLAKILSGILRPISGDIKYNYKSIKKYRRYLPAYFAYTIQNPNWQILFDSVEHEIKYCPEKFDFSKDILVEQVFNILNCREISKEQDPRETSFGQRKFIANHSFMNLPPIHLFDEPEVGLDEQLKCSFVNLLKLRKKLGLISIVITHNSEHLKECVTQTINII